MKLNMNLNKKRRMNMKRTTFNSKNRKKLLMIVDGSNLAHRAFQKFENLKSANGEYTGLIYGFLRSLNSYIFRFQPTYVIVTFDTKQSKSSNFRNNLLGGYKEHRKRISMDYESFNKQSRVVRKILKYLNIPVVWDSKGLGHESDDYIGYYAKKHPGKVVIISSDKDFCQLIDGTIKVFNPFKETVINSNNCIEVMGYSPEECVDYLCLLGDKSDDIPGYRGMGPKRIRQFLDKFGSIAEFLKDPSNEFKGIDYDGLQDLYKRNRILIDLDVALEKYPLKKIPIIYSKRNEVQLDKLLKLFNIYSFQSFKSNTFLEPFNNLQVWQE